MLLVMRFQAALQRTPNLNRPGFAGGHLV